LIDFFGFWGFLNSAEPIKTAFSPLKTLPDYFGYFIQLRKAFLMVYWYAGA
jgi:hypothetical protein